MGWTAGEGESEDGPEARTGGAIKKNDVRGATSSGKVKRDWGGGRPGVRAGQHYSGIPQPLASPGDRYMPGAA